MMEPTTEQLHLDGEQFDHALFCTRRSRDGYVAVCICGDESPRRRSQAIVEHWIAQHVVDEKRRAQAAAL